MVTPRIIVIFFVSAFAASCSLDTSGTAPTNGDGVQEDDVISESMDVDVPDVPAEETPPEVPPDSPCTPGTECGAGLYCCKKTEGTACYDSLEDCDCNGLEDFCSRQAKKCCDMGGGTKICKDETTGCLCDAPEDIDSCNHGQVCCKTSSESTYACSASAEGCLCDPSSPSVESFCGSSRRCCAKSDGLPQCHTDTSDCKCAARGRDQYAECGETAHICCDRGDGELRCGVTEIGCDCSGGEDICFGLHCCGQGDRFYCVTNLNGCACESHLDCQGGTHFLCCNKWFDGGWFNKECTDTACFCECSDMAPHDCTYFGESYNCFGSYCARTIGSC